MLSNLKDNSTNVASKKIQSTRTSMQEVFNELQSSSTYTPAHPSRCPRELSTMHIWTPASPLTICRLHVCLKVSILKPRMCADRPGFIINKIVRLMTPKHL
ncbi:hypothetical protein KC352_g48 [Hortaea werneckii]|nr:hypothetical protein KC352_g48 [Hortaea werneckii]